jgi:Ca-activated chloride channel homolog
MSLTSPGHLWLLVAVVAVALAYVFTQGRRRRYAVRFANLPLLATVAPRRPGWRRHLPAVLLLVALGSQVVALARPVRAERIPRERATIVLAIDVSNSMAATDVDPNRLAAAQSAATAFLADIPESLNVSLVSFSGVSQVVVPPTTDRQLVRAGIASLSLGPRTAIGEAVFTSLQAIDLLTQGTPAALNNPNRFGQGTDRTTDTTTPEEDTPAVIVLMSDGETTTGRPESEAAVEAKERGVPVWTIAYGTDEGFVEFEGEIVPVPVNREALAALAADTDGKAFEAASGQELQAVYAEIGSAIGYETKDRDISSWFTGVALGLALAAAAASVLWFSRIP